MKYVMWSVVTMRTGPNNARHVVWAIGEFFYFISSYFLYTN